MNLRYLLYPTQTTTHILPAYDSWYPEAAKVVAIDASNAYRNVISGGRDYFVSFENIDRCYGGWQQRARHGTCWTSVPTTSVDFDYVCTNTQTLGKEDLVDTTIAALAQANLNTNLNVYRNVGQVTLVVLSGDGGTQPPLMSIIGLVMFALFNGCRVKLYTWRQKCQEITPRCSNWSGWTA